MLSPCQSLDLKVRNKPQTTPARLNRDAPLAAVDDRAVVRYQHQRGAQFLVQLEHQLHDGPAGGEIQADIKLTSRLIYVSNGSPNAVSSSVSTPTRLGQKKRPEGAIGC